ncbi:MAG: UDP-N-acetylglucosamine 2-epimerase (non-hydrolyzing) [Chlorobia bacterium]|nr:UDP-N-acetylglucosamine 2-epimerase (non-hydrolyzing) [Fimbriimonadaceae bacterium]
MAKPRIVCVVGTRPEAIKVAPVVQELRRFGDVDTFLVSTGQHREMLTQSLAAFGLKPDEDLGIMQHGQTLAQVTARAIEGLDGILAKHEPQMVLAQGDTTTTFVAALNSFYRQIPFGHLEAGLRTETISNPFPEEFNRRAASLVANLHFPPTQWSADNLLKEGHPADSIFVTGNTGIDAVLQMGSKTESEWFPEWTGRIVLLTTHRRENWGGPQRQIAHAALRLLDDFEDVLLVVPMHKNPAVRETLTGVLGNHPRARLTEPPDYGDFVPLMKRSHLILSDSGGVQEEAPAFGIPVLVLRDTTERPEGCEAGTAKLVGTEENRIYTEAHVLLSNDHAHRMMAQAVSPYGDGKASARIRYIVLQRLGIDSPEVPMWT